MADKSTIMSTSRRNFLYTFATTLVGTALKLDVPRFLTINKEKDEIDEIREWFMNMVPRVLKNVSSLKPDDMGKRFEVLGMNSIDCEELSMEMEDQYGFQFTSNFDLCRIETGEDLVRSTYFLSKNKQVPLRLLDNATSKREFDIVCENTYSSLITLGAEPELQIKRIGNKLCPGCVLTGYHGEWLRRFHTHPSTRALEHNRHLSKVLECIDALGEAENICVFAGSTDTLIKPGWSDVRDAANHSLSMIRSI